MKSTNNSKTVRAGEECLQNTDSKLEPVYQMVGLFQLDNATYHSFPFLVRFHKAKKHWQFQNDEDWTRNFCKTQIVNWGWPIEWSSYLSEVASTIADLASGPFSRLQM
jgi:hypothetical protein